MKDERITELFTKVANCVDILDKMVRNLEEQVEILIAKIDALESQMMENRGYYDTDRRCL